MIHFNISLWTVAVVGPQCVNTIASMTRRSVFVTESTPCAYRTLALGHPLSRDVTPASVGAIYVITRLSSKNSFAEHSGIWHWANTAVRTYKNIL